MLALPMAMVFLVVRSRLSKLLDGLLTERRILSVMFVDIVNSTVLAVELGDEGWSDKLERFRAVVRRTLDNFGGVEIDTAGDGFFATFAGPGAAHFSDRGRLFQADRGRCFSVIVDAQGMRASEGFNVSQSSTISLKCTDAKRCSRCSARGVAQTYPRRRTALATYRPTRWISRLSAHGHGQ